METRDAKIQGGVTKIDARLKELEDKKKALGKQEVSGLSVKSNSDLAKKYFEMDALEKEYTSRKAELGMTEEEIIVDGYTPKQWKSGIKLQIALNNISNERRDLMEKKAELEKHYTEEYEVDKILSSL